MALKFWGKMYTFYKKRNFFARMLYIGGIIGVVQPIGVVYDTFTATW